jgi:hypothetical protein
MSFTYSFNILATTQISDESQKIFVNDILYESDGMFETEDKAQRAAEAVLIGLDGSKAYNRALESADIEIVERNLQEEAYYYGIEAGYKTLADIADKEVNSGSKEGLYKQCHMLAGLFTVLFHATYTCSPDEKAFDALIEFAKQSAKQDYENDNISDDKVKH